MAECSVNTAKAFMLIAVAAVDGSFGPEELSGIKPALIRAGLTEAESEDALAGALRQYREAIATDTLEHELRACAERIRSGLVVAERRAFMTHLVDAALADDRYQRNEHAFLKTLGAAWEL